MAWAAEADQLADLLQEKADLLSSLAQEQFSLAEKQRIAQQLQWLNHRIGLVGQCHPKLKRIANLAMGAEVEAAALGHHVAGRLPPPDSSHAATMEVEAAREVASTAHLALLCSRLTTTSVILRRRGAPAAEELVKGEQGEVRLPQAKNSAEKLQMKGHREAAKQEDGQGQNHHHHRHRQRHHHGNKKGHHHHHKPTSTEATASIHADAAVAQSGTRKERQKRQKQRKRRGIMESIRNALPIAISIKLDSEKASDNGSARKHHHHHRGHHRHHRKKTEKKREGDLKVANSGGGAVKGHASSGAAVKHKAAIDIVVDGPTAIAAAGTGVRTGSPRRNVHRASGKKNHGRTAEGVTSSGRKPVNSDSATALRSAKHTHTRRDRRLAK